MVLIILGFALGFVYFTTASWPLYIDLVVFGLLIPVLFLFSLIVPDEDTSVGEMMGVKCGIGGMSGAVAFIIMYFWCGLTVSIWWYILAVVVGIIAAFIPAGFYLSSKLMGRWGLQMYRTVFWTL